MNKYIFILVATLFMFCKTKSQNKSNLTSDLNVKIDRYIQEVQQSYNIPGIALVAIKGQEIVHKRCYGVANIEFAVPVTPETLFPIFSTTKVLSVVATLDLIEQNKLFLTTKIGDLLTDIPKSWASVQVQYLLTHSSGLPNIDIYRQDEDELAQQKIFEDSIRFTLGQRFEYNQTNYWLLSKIFQKISNQTLAEYILNSQFASSSRGVIFEGNPAKIVYNQATVYDDHERLGYLKETPYEVPVRTYGASGLSICLDQFIKWEKRFENNEFISPQSKKWLTTSFDYVESCNFSYGLPLYFLDGEVSYGFTGSAASAYRKFPEQKLTIILLANGMFFPTDELGGINEVVDTLASFFLRE